MDYLQPSPNSISFTPDSGSSKCSELVVLQDSDVEGNHILMLSLVTNTADTVIGPVASTLVTIIDDGKSS